MHSEINLPDTDSPEVMKQAVSVYLMNLIWEELARSVNPDDYERHAIGLFDRVYSAVDKTIGG